MKGLIAASFAAVVAAAPSSFSIGTIHKDSAPILSSMNAETVPDSYIVKFKDHVSTAGADDHHSWIQNIHSANEDARLELRKRSYGQETLAEDTFAGVKHVYRLGQSFLGYSGHFDESVIEQVRNHPDVEYIEKDSIVHTMTPVVSEDNKCDDSELEKNSPWGLARISHRAKLTFGTFSKYLYAEAGGEGVDAYVIDTGTNIDHVDFEGRAKWGSTIPEGAHDFDGNGHGSHCSGTIAGKKYGVAKKVNLYAVKVLGDNGSGSMSDVVKGVEYAANSHLAEVQRAKDGKRKGFKGSVANMSLGGSKTRTLDQVVDAAVETGLHFAVAAGNDNADACSYSPAAATKAITVGASALDDSRAYFSNWGKCTDIFAPGLSILSTWTGSEHAINTISGTSMASPHVAGMLAYYLSLQPAIDSQFFSESITPAKLKADLIAIATEGSISDLPEDTPNLLAWNGGGCKDYSAIVKSGGYKAQQPTELAKSSPIAAVEQFEKAIEKEFEAATSALTKKLDSLMEKFEDIVHEIN